MREFTGFTKRNMLVFFKDRQSVFFSMLSPLLVFLLYVLFLKNNYVDSINNNINELADLINADDIDMLVNGLLLSGVLGTAMMSVPYMTLELIVSDKATRKNEDVLATPMKRYKVLLGYYVYSALSAFIITAVVLTLGLIFMAFTGNIYLSVSDIFILYLELLLGVFSATSIFMVFMLIFRSPAACNGFFGVLSAASGFIIGAYIPIATFSKGMQTFCNIFPASGICSLVRNTLMDGIFDHINTSLNNIDKGSFVKSMRETFGFDLFINGNKMSGQTTLIYVSIVSLAFLVANILIYSRFYKRKA